MTGVRVPRSEVLNSRPWAVVKLVGFIIACLVAAGFLLLGGAMLAGARINFRTPAVITPAPPPSMPVPAPTLAPPAPAPAPPIVAQIIPVSVPPAPTPAPTSSDEALEQAYKEKLLAEGENP